MPWLGRLLVVHSFFGVAEAYVGAQKVGEKGGYAMGLSMLGGLVLTMGLWHFVHWPDVDVRKATWTVISNTTSIFCAVLLFSFGNEFFNKILFSGFASQGFEHRRYLNQFEVVICYSILFLSLARRCGLGCGKAYRQCVVEGQRPEFLFPCTPCFKNTVKKDALEQHEKKAKKPRLGIFSKMFHTHTSWLYEKTGFSVSLVWAHTCGFAGIAGWGMVQTDTKNRDYYKTPLSSAMLIPDAFFKWFFVLVFLKALRDSTFDGRLQTWLSKCGIKCFDRFKLEDAEEDGSDGEDNQKGNILIKDFKELIADGENDMYGLFVSFLIVQSLRFWIGGVLPNEEGVEKIGVAEDGTVLPGPCEKECQTPVHDLTEILGLYGSGITLMLIGCSISSVSVLLKPCKKPLKNKAKSLSNNGFYQFVLREVKDTFKRFEEIFKNICFMSCSWCVMYATEWVIIYTHLAAGDLAARKVLLATICTLIGFLVILFMDEFADYLEEMHKEEMHRSDEARRRCESSTLADTSETMSEGLLKKKEKTVLGELRKSPREIMKYVGFLIGFCWENAFDNAVDGITAAFNHTEFTKCLVTTAIGVGSIWIIMPAWHNYILPMTEVGHGHLLGINPHRLVTKVRRLRQEVERKPHGPQMIDLINKSTLAVIKVLEAAMHDKSDANSDNELKVLLHELVQFEEEENEEEGEEEEEEEGEHDDDSKKGCEVFRLNACVSEQEGEKDTERGVPEMQFTKRKEEERKRSSAGSDKSVQRRRSSATDGEALRQQNAALKEQLAEMQRASEASKQLNATLTKQLAEKERDASLTKQLAEKQRELDATRASLLTMSKDLQAHKQVDRERAANINAMNARMGATLDMMAGVEEKIREFSPERTSSGRSPSPGLASMQRHWNQLGTPPVSPPWEAQQRRYDSSPARHAAVPSPSQMREQRVDEALRHIAAVTAPHFAPSGSIGSTGYRSPDLQSPYMSGNLQQAAGVNFADRVPMPRGGSGDGLSNTQSRSPQEVSPARARPLASFGNEWPYRQR